MRNLTEEELERFIDRLSTLTKRTEFWARFDYKGYAEQLKQSTKAKSMSGAEAKWLYSIRLNLICREAMKKVVKWEISDAKLNYLYSRFGSDQAAPKTCLPIVNETEIRRAMERKISVILEEVIAD